MRRTRTRRPACRRVCSGAVSAPPAAARNPVRISLSSVLAVPPATGPSRTLRQRPASRWPRASIAGRATRSGTSRRRSRASAAASRTVPPPVGPATRPTTARTSRPRSSRSCGAQTCRTRSAACMPGSAGRSTTTTSPRLLGCTPVGFLLGGSAQRPDGPRWLQIPIGTSRDERHQRRRLPGLERQPALHVRVRSLDRWLLRDHQVGHGLQPTAPPGT